jgi:ABC-2 type transport system permease protein
MSKTLTVVRKEYMERVRSKSFLIGTLLGPLLMSMFIVVPMLLVEAGGDDARTVGVIDRSGRFLEPLQEALIAQGDDHITLLPINVESRSTAEGVDDLKEMVLDQGVNSGIVIDRDFLENRQVTFYSKSVSAMVMRDRVLRPALDRVLRSFRFETAGVPESLNAYLSAPAKWNSIAVTAEGEKAQHNEDAAFIMAVVLILILYMMVIMYGSHTLTAVIEEKGSRVVEVLLASVQPANLMLGKVLGIGLAGLTQFGVWTAAFFVISLQGVTLGGLTLDTTFLTPVILLSFLIFFLLGFFLYATIYAGVGAMCNTVQDSQQFHTPIVMGLVIPMMMLSFVLRAPDSTVAVVLSLVPLFSPVLMFMRICVQTPPLWQILLSWVLMVLAIWGAARLAGKLFRVGILMYGTSPTWASLMRVLREG